MGVACNPQIKRRQIMATFTNQATLSYRDTVVNSNIVTGELLESLAITKTSLTQTYNYNDVVTYVVNITNTGLGAQTGLTFTDDLGQYEFGTPPTTTPLTPLTYVDGTLNYYVGGVLQATPTVTAGPPLTVTGINVPAGGNALLIYQARVNEFAPLAQGGTIENTATLSSADPDRSVSDSATITVAAEPELSITKALSPAVVSEDGQLTYTFTIRNFGNTAVVTTDNAVITDTFDPILDITSVTYNGAAWAAPANYTYNDATGEFATVAGQIEVPAATYTQDATTGVVSVIPGQTVITVTGTV